MGTLFSELKGEHKLYHKGKRIENYYWVNTGCFFSNGTPRSLPKSLSKAALCYCCGPRFRFTGRLSVPVFLQYQGLWTVNGKKVKSPKFREFVSRAHALCGSYRGDVLS